MWRRFLPWLFPLLAFVSVGIVLGVWISARNQRNSVPSLVDPDFIKPFEEVSEAQSELGFYSVQFSEEIQDPFFSDTACFFYRDDACQKYIVFQNEQLLIRGGLVPSISANSWS